MTLTIIYYVTAPGWGDGVTTCYTYYIGIEVGWVGFVVTTCPCYSFSLQYWHKRPSVVETSIKECTQWIFRLLIFVDLLHIILLVLAVS